MGEQLAEAQLAEAQLQDGTYLIDTGKSVLEWIGRNLNNRHYGHITIQDGEVVVQGGNPVAGRIVLDMNSIDNIDLQDQGWRDMLIAHLKSVDFFSVAQYPTALFRLTVWEDQEGVLPEARNGKVAGELTIKDVTRPISFTAIVAPQADGSIKAHAAFDIDRTLWNVCYGSCKLFERLGMHMVHDIISLELFIVARKAI
jgi:polyisoprenoid-binding protein YceI